MASEDHFTFEIVETWTVEALKQFVRKRGLPVSGSKKVQAARAYVAWELKVVVFADPRGGSSPKVRTYAPAVADF